MRTQLPVLAGGALAVTGQPAPIPAGSATWFAWLDEPATRTFAFRDAAGSFTARKERKQRGGDYWVAYRKRDGKLQKHYLGKSADLTLERLLRAAQALMVTPAPAQHVPPTPPRATPLLRAKLFAPPARADLVPRPQLWGLLDQSVHTRLVLVAAPAGFGKSTLLSQWSASSPAERRPLAPDRAFAWLTLDATDNDPIQFLRYVVMALQGIAPGLGVAALALLEVDHGRSLPASPVDALTALANDLTTLPGHTWLVLDDYHAVHDRAVHAALAFLLDHLPPQLHIVLATREDPPLPLARLRARREITELRAADLRFTSAETGTFLCERMRLPLAAAEVAALDTRTEGWIAGLQLAALALQQRSDYASFVAGFTGSHRFVMEYLVEDVLARLPAHIQRFLLHTSILTQLSAPLCAAVLGDVGGDLAQALLEELERGNVFVVPLDDERSLYRYHHLFADAVRSQLQHLAAPGERDRLHARAAAWLAANGQPAEAIRHAFAAHDEGWACDLIEGQVLPALLQGLGATVAGWLDAVPEATQLTRPRLLLAQVWLALVRADYVAVTQRLAEAEAALVARGAPSEQQGELAGTRAMVAGLLNDPVAVQYGIAALGQLPPDHPLRPTVALMLGYVYLSAGDLAGADQTLLRTMGAEAPDPRFFADRATLLAVLGMVRRAQGRLSAAAQLCADALALVRQGAQLKPLAGACLALMTVATIEYERNNVDTADEQLRLCRELGRQCGMAIADILGQFYSTPIMAARGDIPGAVALLDRTLEQAHEQGSPPATIREIEGYRALLWLRQGQPERAAQWAAQQAATPRPPLTPYDYDRFALVRLLMAEARWDAAEQALADLLERAQTTGHRRFEVWARVLGAALGHARGAPDDALAHLAAALELAEPEGYIRMFVDEGQSIAALLQRYAARRGAHALYARRILAAFPRAEAPAADPLVEPLTAREREVLLRIAAGASNQEIADQLIITVGTVKKYVHAICGKLGVQRRTQAVAEARALGLL